MIDLVGEALFLPPSIVFLSFYSSTVMSWSAIVCTISGI